MLLVTSCRVSCDGLTFNPGGSSVVPSLSMLQKQVEDPAVANH